VSPGWVDGCVVATFERWEMVSSRQLPIAAIGSFAIDDVKLTQWWEFVNRGWRSSRVSRTADDDGGVG
jgi:hypothetical protein